MEDLNDIYFFASVVQYGGFSAAARTIGIEKTRLSRRIAALERRLGVRLLQRTTRALAVTEAGQLFFERCVSTVEGAQAAYDSVAITSSALTIYQREIESLRQIDFVREVFALGIPMFGSCWGLAACNRGGWRGGRTKPGRKRGRFRAQDHTEPGGSQAPHACRRATSCSTHRPFTATS